MRTFDKLSIAVILSAVLIGTAFTAVPFQKVSAGVFCEEHPEDPACQNGNHNGHPEFDVTKDFRFTNVSFTTVPAYLGQTLPQDSEDRYLVDAVLGTKTKDVVKSTNPGQMFEVITVTNTGSVDADSLHLTNKIPINWLLNPAVAQPGAIDVLFQCSTCTAPVTVQVITSFATLDYPDKGTLGGGTPVDPCDGTQGTVTVNIASITAAAGEPFGPGDKIFIFKKLIYGLKNLTVDTTGYPCDDEDTATVTLDDGFGVTDPVVAQAKLRVDKK
ncbi:MAG: hypothetical protein ACRD32_06595 [Nitrososphaerales archaeon]